MDCATAPLRRRSRQMRRGSSYDAPMKILSSTTVTLIAVALSAAGCKTSFKCPEQRARSALSAWQGRGFDPARAEVDICEASAKHLDAVFYGSPGVAGTWNALKDRLDHDGWKLSPQKGYAPRLASDVIDATMEKCTTFGPVTLNCTDEL